MENENERIGLFDELTVAVENVKEADQHIRMATMNAVAVQAKFEDVRKRLFKYLLEDVKTTLELVKLKLTLAWSVYRLDPRL